MATHFQTKFSVGSDNLDKARGIVRSCALLTMGEIQGHNCVADSKSLATLLACAKKAKKVKVKLDHGPSLGQVIGSLSSFRMSDDGTKVLGNLTLLKSAESYDFVLDLIENLSGQIGLSIAFSPSFDTGPNGTRLVRCDELYSVDLVSDPAQSNPDGLFDAGLVNTPAVVPTGVKPKTRKINIVCPNCQSTNEFLSKLGNHFSAGANKLDAAIARLEAEDLAQRDNISSKNTEAEFQRRLAAAQMEFEKKHEARVSIEAQRMLARTGISLRQIPDSDVSFATSGDGILTRLQTITDPVEQGRFYQKNKERIQEAFKNQAAKNIELQNRLTAEAGIQ
jgi:hypothetical protein